MLADALDALAVATMAGLSLEQALREQARGEGEAARLWHRCLAAYDGGLPLFAALTDELAQLGQAGTRLARTLRLGEALGVPVAETLREQAAVLRRSQRQQAIRWAGAMPMRLTLIAVFLLLPPILALVLVPGLLAFFQSWR